MGGKAMAMNSTAKRRGAIAEINVTPMADIMIVLLIIFMVVTPIVDRGPVKELPLASHPRQAAGKIVEVSLSRGGSVYLDRKELGSARELLPRLQDRLAALPEGDRIIGLKADALLPYDDVRGVLSVCRAAGVEEIVLMTAVADYRR
jgi:biopolymer transport protein TolR